MHFCGSIIVILLYCLHVKAEILQTSTAMAHDAIVHLPGTHVSVGSSALSHSRRLSSQQSRSEIIQRDSQPLSLVGSGPSQLYNTTVSNSGSIGFNNSSHAFNGTKIDAASAPGLDAVFGHSTSSSSAASSADQEASVTNATYQNLIRYVKFSAAAYVQQCSYPNNATLLHKFGSLTSTQTTGLHASSLGYLARDDTSQELIVAFQGDPSMQSVPSATSSGSSLVDASIIGPAGTLVNPDLLTTFMVNRMNLSQTLQSQLAAHPDYGITFTGHGSGGALAIMAGVSLIASLGSTVPMQIITFGAPRVGNAAWANYTETNFVRGTLVRHLRVTHADDNIPQILTRSNGYLHAAVELYETDSGVDAASMTKCTGAEDPDCNLGQSISSMTTNVAANAIGSGVASYLVPAPSSLSGIVGTLNTNSDQSGLVDNVATPSSSIEDGSLAAPIFTTVHAATPTDSSSQISGSVSCSSCLDPSSTVGTRNTSTADTVGDTTDPLTGMTYDQEMEILQNQLSTMQLSNTVDVSTGMTYAQEMQLLQEQLQSSVSNSQTQTIANQIQGSTNTVAGSTTGKYRRAVTDGVASGVANAAHMMYLGVQMNQDGPKYCMAQAATDGVTKIPTSAGNAGSGASTDVNAAALGDLQAPMTSGTRRHDPGDFGIFVTLLIAIFCSGL